jgi:hypothetical protein
MGALGFSAAGLVLLSVVFVPRGLCDFRGAVPFIFKYSGPPRNMTFASK